MVEKKVNNKGDDTLYGVLSGRHICLFYAAKKDLIDLVVPYFNEGLKLNKFCMWVVSKPLGVKEAKEILSRRIRSFDTYMKKGQLEILDCKDWYLKSGKFNPKEVLESWARKEKQAIKEGFSGLRVSGDTSWLRQKDWANFIHYEKKVDKLIPKLKMSVLCTYPIDKVDISDILILSANHRFAFCNKNNKWHIIKNVKLGNLLYNIKYFVKKQYKRKR